jgi:hypothetical protein
VPAPAAAYDGGMWPFRRRPDLLEQQRRELERDRLRRTDSPPLPIGGRESANWHGTTLRISVRGSRDGQQAPGMPDDDMFPPGTGVHEFSGTPGELAAQLGKALLRSLVGRPRKP